LRNGIEIRRENAVMQITALREDVLRIRIGTQGHLPEDASWAVLADARLASVPVSVDDDTTAVGFRTAALRGRVERTSLRLQIHDLQGLVVQEDAVNRPIEIRGPSFRVYKTMPPNEHFFGLGDKPGPLDRRDHAYHLWNTA